MEAVIKLLKDKGPKYDAIGNAIKQEPCLLYTSNAILSGIMESIGALKGCENKLKR